MQPTLLRYCTTLLTLPVVTRNEAAPRDSRSSPR